MRTARRVERIDPFYVMECAKAADRIARTAACDPARGGEPMIYLNIGEPDFGALPAVAAAAQRCIAESRTQYTHAVGLASLREALSRWYAERWQVAIDPRRIVVTAGASAALQLACLALFDAGDEVLMPDPSYPCNRHFVAAADATPVLMPCGPEQRYQPRCAQIEAAWHGATRGVLLASPSNPTGTAIAFDELGRIVEAVRTRGGVTLIDEIYLGLSYEAAFGRTALALDGAADSVVSINSFSKTFCMTGWRLGWLVLPPALVPAVEKLAQNLFICPSTIAQHAALACFHPESLALYEERRREFQRRRDYLVPQLRDMGFSIPVMPDGAFYVYADISAFGTDSAAFARRLLHEAGVAVTPGQDFGTNGADRHIRLSYTTSIENIEEGLARLKTYLL
ncbi:MAG: pyridoxal phosphate-dependent aminotransferase [Burkholderiaceae bacterium]